MISASRSWTAYPRSWTTASCSPLRPASGPGFGCCPRCACSLRNASPSAAMPRTSAGAMPRPISKSPRRLPSSPRTWPGTPAGSDGRRTRQRPRRLRLGNRTRRCRSRAASCRRDVAVLAGARAYRGGLGHRPACPGDAGADARPRPAGCPARCRGGVAWWRGDTPTADRFYQEQSTWRADSASRGPSRTRCSISATPWSSATTRPRAKRSGEAIREPGGNR